MPDSFTPGPWRVMSDPIRPTLIVEAVPGKLIALCDMTRRSDAENTANAWLCAAAPELLAACRLALDHVPESSYAGVAIRTAIVRAVGTPPSNQD